MLISSENSGGLNWQVLDFAYVPISLIGSHVSFHDHTTLSAIAGFLQSVLNTVIDCFDPHNFKNTQSDMLHSVINTTMLFTTKAANVEKW